MSEAAALYSIPEAQKQLGDIGRSQLFELLADGRLRSVKLGRRRFVPASAIAEFVAQLEATA